MKHRYILITCLWLTSLLSQANNCQPLDIQPLLARQPEFLLLGEMHGTDQSPGFTGELACNLLATGRELILGLEIPTTEQDHLTAYLTSDGSDKAKVALLSGDHWDSAKWADGRSSAAMLQLIERARVLRQAGKPIELIAFGSGGDAAYAQQLASARKNNKQLVLALVGNLHANRAETSSYTGVPPMGYLLNAQGRTVSLNVSYPGGKAWACMSGELGCGIYPLTGSPKALAAGTISLTEAKRDKTWLYDGWYDVGELSASPPAKPLPTAKPPV